MMKHKICWIFVIFLLCGAGFGTRTAEAQGFKHTSQEDMYYMKMKNRAGSAGIGYFQMVDIYFKERMQRHRDGRDWFAWRFDIGGVPYFYIDDFQRVGNMSQSHVNTAAVTSQGHGTVGNNSGWGWGHDWDKGYGGGGYGSGGGGGHRDSVDSRITWFPDTNIEDILNLAGNKQHPSWEYEIDKNGSDSMYSLYGGSTGEGTDYLAGELQDYVSASLPMVELGIPVSDTAQSKAKISVLESLGLFHTMTVAEQPVSLISVEEIGGAIGFEKQETAVSMSGYSMEMVPSLISISPVGELALSADAAYLLATYGSLTLGNEMSQRVNEMEEQAKHYAQASSRLSRSSLAMNVGLNNFTDFNPDSPQNASATSADSLMLSGSIAGRQGNNVKVAVAKPAASESSSLASEAVPMAGGDASKTNDVPEPSGFLLILLGIGMLLQRKRRSQH